MSEPCDPMRAPVALALVRGLAERRANAALRHTSQSEIYELVSEDASAPAHSREIARHRAKTLADAARQAALEAEALNIVLETMEIMTCVYLNSPDSPITPHPPKAITARSASPSST